MMTEDLDTFIDLNVFAVPGVVGTASYGGIYDRRFAEVNGVEGFYPQFLVKSTDAAKISLGSTITIETAKYKVMSKRPDGYGFTLMLLEVTT